MLKFTSTAFNKARCYINANARSLEKRLFEFYFNNGSTEAVLHEIERYQNHDGGFGNGIEPDFTLKASSPMATSVAFQYLKSINVNSSHIIVKKGIDYLINSYDKAQQLWHAIPPEVNNEPHAPWWHYDINNGGCEVEKHWGNPNAEIVAYLNKYKSLVPTDFLSEVTDLTINKLVSHEGTFEMHEYLCYLRLYEELPESKRQLVKEKLRKNIRNILELNPKKWSEYGAHPFEFAFYPNFIIVDLFYDELQANFDFKIKCQTEEGSWVPNWVWGDYPEAWENARKAWKGILTVNVLKRLYDFGRYDITI